MVNGHTVVEFGGFIVLNSNKTFRSLSDLPLFLSLCTVMRKNV